MNTPTHTNPADRNQVKPKYNPYRDNGYSSRADYLDSLADEYGCSSAIVYAAADILGPGEDFDGLICALEDYEAGIY